MKSMTFSGRWYLAPLLSGLLLGVSFPTYPAVHLEPLAWVALVPLLLSLRHATTMQELFRRVYLAMQTFALISLWWVSLATLPGGLLTVVVQALFLVLPFLLFFLLQQWAGFRFALLSFPFLQTGWEWAFIQQDFSFGWLTFGNSQATLLPMIQYAEFTGVWGISFWLAWFNVLTVMLLLGEGGRRKIVVAGTMILMVAVPLVHSFLLFARADDAAKRADREGSLSRLHVKLIQPDVDPYKKWTNQRSLDIVNRFVSLTDRELAGKKTDLVIWPETALPFYIFHPYFDADRRLLWQAIGRWKCALLTGFVDMRYADQAPPVSFNASVLLEDGNPVPWIYRKMRLVPFGERVPFVDVLPWLDKASFTLSGIRGWGRGEKAQVMRFYKRDRSGTVAVGNVICYESIFPGLVSQFVANGAQLLTLITNDGWYGTSYGPYQHLAIARLRCIENRRSMARCANTGVSAVLDPFGRTQASMPWWQEGGVSATVELHDRITFYTAHPDLLPKASSAVFALLFLTGWFRGRRQQEPFTDRKS